MWYRCFKLFSLLLKPSFSKYVINYDLVSALFHTLKAVNHFSVDRLQNNTIQTKHILILFMFLFQSLVLFIFHNNFCNTYLQVENVIDQSACTACNIKAAFFQPDRVSQLLQLLLTKCLLLSTSELTEWSEDAEIFYIAQEGTFVHTCVCVCVCVCVDVRTYKCDISND